MPGFELIGKEEANAIADLFQEGGILFAHGFDSIRKKYHVKEFEAEASSKFGATYCAAVSSGTAALKCSLKAIGVKPGDEVITQSFNFIATIEAIIDCGAIPIVCDIDDNLHMDLDDIRQKITKKTKAIIIVHMLGMGGPLDELMKFGNSLNLPIIEDNCEAIGAKFDDNYLGVLGDIGVMSFDHGKMIACGEGGMIFTNNKKYGEFVKQYRDHGHENNSKLPRGRDNRIMPGFNYRMTEMQGVIGKVQLSKLDFMINENRERYLILDKYISKVFNVRKELTNHNGSYDTFIFSLENQYKRNLVIDILMENNFGTKNLPDAMEWHCSYFWPHALTESQINASKKTFDILKKQIAIPIMLKRSLEEYEKLAKIIFEKFSS
tara:strand:- start:476 stop:1612 length:1137 start_codon:yes stop_codon:yes gene_type:complete